MQEKELKRRIPLTYFHLEKYERLLSNLQEKKAQAFTTIALTLFSLSVFGFFAINPTLSTIAQLKKELQDSRYVNEQLDKKISALRSLQNQYFILQGDLPIILQAVPQKPTTPPLVGQITFLANEQHIALERIEVFQVELAQAKKQDETNHSFSFSLSGKGTYEDISQFVSTLSQFDRAVTVDVVSINKPFDNNPLLNVNIRGRAYFKS